MVNGVNHITTADVRILNMLIDIESVYVCRARESTPRNVLTKSDALLPIVMTVTPAMYSFRFNIFVVDCRAGTKLKTERSLG